MTWTRNSQPTVSSSPGSTAKTSPSTTWHTRTTQHSLQALPPEPNNYCTHCREWPLTSIYNQPQKVHSYPITHISQHYQLRRRHTTYNRTTCKVSWSHTQQRWLLTQRRGHQTSQSQKTFPRAAPVLANTDLALKCKLRIYNAVFISLVTYAWNQQPSPPATTTDWRLSTHSV